MKAKKEQGEMSFNELTMVDWRGRAGAGLRKKSRHLTARTRIVLMASQSFSVYPIIAFLF